MLNQWKDRHLKMLEVSPASAARHSWILPSRGSGRCSRLRCSEDHIHIVIGWWPLFPPPPQCFFHKILSLRTSQAESRNGSQRGDAVIAQRRRKQPGCVLAERVCLTFQLSAPCRQCCVCEGWHHTLS